MLNKIENKNIYFTPTFNMYKITEWQQLSNQSFTYSLMDNSDSSFIRYPGLIFSNEAAAEYFIKNYYLDHRKTKKTGGYPRGNLSKNNNIIIIGQRPGHHHQKAHKLDTTNWMCGIATVEILMAVCLELNIYPYFTNYYKMYNDEATENKLIYQELEVLKYIYQNIYKIKELKLVFLGKYFEYDLIIQKYYNDPFFKFLKINHPAYIARFNSIEKYENWKNSLKLFI